jgi:hypothetical protein
MAFVVKHATDVQVGALPVYEGWSFDPDWKASPLLSHGWRNTVSYVWPLIAGGILFATYLTLRARRRITSSLPETLILVAVSTALAIGLAWFFLVDPTQWGRHLMPMIYVAMALGLYCAAEICRSVPRTGRAAAWSGVLVCAAVLVAGGFAYASTRSYVASEGWKVSYAKTCRATPPLMPPCHNGDALNLVDALAKEWCGPETRAFSPTDYCKVKNRDRFVAHAIETLADPTASEKTVHTAGYLIALIQSYDYPVRDDFLEDLAPLVCGRREEPLLSRLERLEIGPNLLATICSNRDVDGDPGD